MFGDGLYGIGGLIGEYTQPDVIAYFAICIVGSFFAIRRFVDNMTRNRD
jgi:hypothetical protein